MDLHMQKWFLTLGENRLYPWSVNDSIIRVQRPKYPPKQAEFSHVREISPKQVPTQSDVASSQSHFYPPDMLMALDL